MKQLFGTEIEYGLKTEGRGAREQIDDACEFIAACPVESFVGWDYGMESPRCDLRGFSVEQLSHDPIDAQFDDIVEGRSERMQRADRVLRNGARFYNDHGHPEYATPECTRIADLVAHELAGERIVYETAKRYSERSGRAVSLFKNNTDYHGASYGAHESFLVSRNLSFDALLNGLLPLFVTRQILVGAGKVGSESGGNCKYQLSQRADFFHEKASVETLYRRPLFNTRDEPHADASKWLRLHVICGDANRMPWCIAMKAGMVQIALSLIEIGECPIWALRDPVRTCSEISKDASHEWRVELESGSWTTGTQILDSYVSAGEKLLLGKDTEADWVLGEWRLALLELSQNRAALANRVDWIAKERLLKLYANELGDWDEGSLQSVELEYHNLSPDESLFSALVQSGEVMAIIPVERELDAMTEPPMGTRAVLRGHMVRHHQQELETIGWRRAVLKNGADPRVVEFEPFDGPDKQALIEKGILEWKTGQPTQADVIE